MGFGGTDSLDDVKIKGSDDTEIGNVGDSLKVVNTNDDDNPNVVTDDLANKVTNKKIICLLDELIRQMRILNTHMGSVTDLEDLEEEPGDHPIV